MIFKDIKKVLDITNYNLPLYSMLLSASVENFMITIKRQYNIYYNVHSIQRRTKF